MEINKNMNTTKERELIYNAMRCKRCNAIVVSRSRHDYQVCNCEEKYQVSNDGGLDYEHRGFPTNYDDCIEDMSAYDNDPFEKIREVFAWGSYGKNGDEALHYIPLNKISDGHISAILKTQKNIRPVIKDLFIKEQEYRTDNGILI